MNPVWAVASALVLVLLLIRLRGAMVRLHRLSNQQTVQHKALRVAFLHPDLGIGGAERLVVDAALALKARGHDVLITTAHHDRSRCFEETRDGTLVVHVAGSSVPRNIGGRLHIVCATLRALFGALWLVVFEPGCDAIFVDAVPAAVPLLRICGLPVLFYCHFPDKLLAAAPSAKHARSVGRILRRAYRLPFDVLEELCTGAASQVVVNSAYTASVYATSFPLLRVRPAPAVLHPAIDLERNPPMERVKDHKDEELVLVSINRFERKKALELAIHALRELRSGTTDERAPARRLKLVLAGGYDDRLQENVDYFAELATAVAEGGMDGVVTLRRNVSEAERRALFASCAAVVYTPSYEHFGIVPLEAMAAARPVVAVGLGGPCESVVHGESGWLCDPTPTAFAAAFAEVLELHRLGRLEARGAAARARVVAAFSLPRFGQRLEAHLRAIS